MRAHPLIFLFKWWKIFYIFKLDDWKIPQKAFFLFQLRDCQATGLHYSLHSSPTLLHVIWILYMSKCRRVKMHMFCFRCHQMSCVSTKVKSFVNLCTCWPRACGWMTCRVKPWAARLDRLPWFSYHSADAVPIKGTVLW